MSLEVGGPWVCIRRHGVGRLEVVNDIEMYSISRFGVPR